MTMKSVALKEELIKYSRELNQQMEQFSSTDNVDLDSILANIAQIQSKLIGYQYLLNWENEVQSNLEKLEAKETAEDQKAEVNKGAENELTNLKQEVETTVESIASRDEMDAEIKEEAIPADEHVEQSDKAADSTTDNNVKNVDESSTKNKPSPQVKDLNELFHTEKDPSLSGQLSKQPISDLFTAIGLNERYLYANELFDGNLEEFKEAIRVLNECESHEKAACYCRDELQKKYAWEDDNALFLALTALIERRYLQNR